MGKQQGEQMNLTQLDTKLQPITTVVLLGLSILSLLAIETSMTTYFNLQILIIVAFGAALAGIIYGTINETPWAQPAATLFFALALANLVVIFAFNKAFLPLAFGALVNVSGIVLTTVIAKKGIDWSILETYEVKHAAEKKAKAAKKAKSRKRK
jgi:hypothetical protein